MSPQAIPGYHYDEAKKKYFKIIPDHVAPPGSRYSQSSLTEEARNEYSRKRLKIYEEKNVVQRIQRSKVLTHPLIGGTGVSRIIATNLGRDVSGPRAWAQGLKMSKICTMPEACPLFMYDESTGLYVITNEFGHPPFGTVRYDSSLSYAIDDNIPTLAVRCLSAGRVVSMEDRRSFHIEPALCLDSQVRVTALGSDRAALVHITRMKPLSPYDLTDDDDDPDVAPPLPYLPQFSSHTVLRPLIPGSTLWASSSRPVPHRSDFALGTSDGTILVGEEQGSWTFLHRMPFDNPSHGGHYPSVEVLAVDWLNENVVMSGCRDGNVRLWDVRTKNAITGTSTPLMHPSAISYVRKLNANKIVVAGLENKMSIYDLRFLQKSRQGRLVTRPFNTCPEYKNRDRNALAVGLDVLGDELIAIGTDDERVQIFDAGTGREINAGGGGALGKRKLGGLASCLRFVSGDGKRESTKLLIAAGRRIEEWAW